MRNLNGYLKITQWIFSFLLALFFSLSFSPHKADALDGFDIQSDFHHIWDGQEINSTIYLTITTTANPRVLTYYTVTIPEENLRPEVFSITKNSKLEPTYYDRQSATDLVIDLENTLVSKEKPVTLKLTYSTKHSQETLSLISSVKDTTSRGFTFTYPHSLGDIGWSSTPIINLTQKGQNIEIETAPPKSSKVSISLGDKIIYQFAISRNLINSSDEIISSEISIPPSTNTQKILLINVQPKPNRSYKDINGNYILQYEIAPQSNIAVSIEGSLQMEKSISINPSTPRIETKNLWELKDTDLEKRVNKWLKDSGLTDTDIESIYDIKSESRQQMIYKELYQFVIKNLQPNTLTIGSLTGSVRLGGERALSEQADSTSEDYADAMITLFRYFDIPARLVIGYVTNISDYHPDGMYHYWVEYFDLQKKDWIQVDPFLEDYSNTSLWSRPLPDHISLLFRYDNPNTPKLPYYTENDFKISIQESTPEPVYSMNADIFLKPYNVLNSHLQGSIRIENSGNTVLDSINFVKSKPNLNLYTDYIENNSSTILLPGDITEIQFNIPSDKIESPLYAVLSAQSGTELTNEEYLETEIDLIEDSTLLNILSKIFSILIYIAMAIPMYFLIKKFTNRNG
ncbi:MAG: transglutaminase-like domain-containing protein [Candidatus Dojkabacteria bacterium]|jgi:hypothetical protein|nr:transglutaminase-like domain-containing protein [Candidatus Dojkabacteria bacterium]